MIVFCALSLWNRQEADLKHLFFFRFELEATDVSFPCHAFVMLDSAIGKGFHQSPIQMTNCKILFRERVKDAVVGFSDRLIAAHAGISCVVAS
jgi:hypothetical protein